MNLSTDEGIREALQEIASWPAADRTANDAPATPTIVERSESVQRTRPRSRLLLFAAILVVTVGIGGLFLNRSATNETTAADDLGAGLTRAAAIELCLDIESNYNVEQLRSDGTLHLFGDTASSQLPLVLETNSLHAACGLAQRDNGDWYKVTAVVNTHLPLNSSDDVSVLVTIGLGERIYVAGQTGTDVEAVEIETSTTRYDGQVDNGWWGASFDFEAELLEAFPDFVVLWTASTGEASSALGSDLRPNLAWLLCAEDAGCRSERLAELSELAKALPTNEQADVLEDGTVTDEEYRAVFRSWGDCVAESTGATVTYDKNGLFTIHETDGPIDAEFAACQEMHASFVIEAASIQATPLEP